MAAYCGFIMPNQLTSGISVLYPTNAITRCWMETFYNMKDSFLRRRKRYELWKIIMSSKRFLF